MPEQTASSGRELARARRAMLAQSGKAGVAKAGSRPVRSAAPRPVESAKPAAPERQPAPQRREAPVARQDRNPGVSTQRAPEIVQTTLSGHELARARRAMLAQSGKAGSGPGRSVAPRPVESAKPPVDARSNTEDAPVSEDVTQELDLDALCEVAEHDPAALGASANDVRRLCRDRRQALATKGKAALTGKAGAPFWQSGPGSAFGSSTGRIKARQHRAQMSQIGRGDAPPARPASRVHPNRRAPEKVEVGTTLSGQYVTGTQVERKPQVTGGEAGTCRVVTGTEYMGAEHFETFCGTRPEPVGARVGVSATSAGNRLTANAPVGSRSSRVTGDEAGGCRAVTGTEYLGGEHFEAFCENKGLLKRPEKVVMGRTQRKELPVTGSDEARPNRVTGLEPGAARSVTGSQYADAGVARLTINGPSKVALTHTVAGRPVTGTEVGASVKVTGEEAGQCRNITGTEYLSTEQFQSICNTKAAPAPAKVGQDKSRGGQRITGNLVDASDKVTGNEPGTNQHVTGAQYGSPMLQRRGVEKVEQMRTLAGGSMTGSRAGHGPKLTGDEHGGCQPVTGTEYYGREHYDTYCSGTPAPTAAKVGLSQTRRGLVLSGTMLARSERVTGNEPGSNLEVSGTPYASPVQAAACDCGGEGRAVAAFPGGVMPRRQSSRYLAPADRPLPQAVEPAPVPVEMRRTGGFSVSSPARFAQETRQRITGSTYGSGSTVITGPATRADGLVSGTPEFRYRDEMPRVRSVQPAQNAELLEVQEDVAQPARITGEGRDAGIRITGDDWARSGRVTGTEGRWAQSRNPTLRGELRPMTSGARTNKDLERAEVSSPKVTGASGNSAKGALITVSGGARG